MAATPKAVDAESTIAWLRKEIVFDHEPLDHVVPNSIATREADRGGHSRASESTNHAESFSTDDTDAFIAFLRSLKGVQVEVNATQIRVTRN